MTVRALTFGSVAQAYERFRPGYPPELVETVLGYADRPVRTALEIGAGTGKATRAFAAYDVAVTATEPDAAMLAELRRQVPGDVVTQQATLEELDVSGSFDLVYAAASLHWTKAEGRWERVAGRLGPGGVFAAFGGAYHLSDPAHEDALRDARAPYLADDSAPVPSGDPAVSQLRWPGDELAGTGLFVDVQELTIERRFDLDTMEFVGYLSTVSAYLTLTERRRSQALTAIGAALPATVPITADVTVHLARRH